MQRRIKILDGISIVFLTLLSLNFLLFFGLQGDPLGRLFPGIFAGWGEAAFFVVLAVVTGAIVHLLGSYKSTGAFLFVAFLWVILVVGFVFGFMPTEFTVRTISWKLVAFGYPLIYMYWIRKGRRRGYFRACAWVYTLSTLGILAGGLAGGSSALLGAAGPIPFVITAFFMSVSIYLACRLILVR